MVNRKLFRSVDYCLLLTFLFFFIFIGNLKRIPALNAALLSLVNGHKLCTDILASQIISNVPAAILLSGFTQDYATLLTAVNLGGLGTLIASLASLIAFKFYGSAYPERKGAFLKVFTLFNIGFLLVLTGLADPHLSRSTSISAHLTTVNPYHRSRCNTVLSRFRL